MQRQSHLIGLFALSLGCADADDDAPSCHHAEIGESCSNLPCVEGAECDDDDICKEPSEVGESCEPVGCAEGLLCDFQAGGCVALPTEGEPCRAGRCGLDLFCLADPVDPTMRTCTAVGELDDACMGHGQCASEYCPAGFCKPLPENGESCFDKCSEGHVCSGQTCMEIEWMACDSDGD